MARLLIIGISALGGGLLFIWLFAIVYPVRFPDWLGLALFGLSCAVGGGIAWWFVGRPSLKPTMVPRVDYEKLGLLEEESFTALRAFEVEEFEDEGLHYFLELEDDRVLNLNGQYLYDYGEIADDPDLNQAAGFPNTKFVIRRRKTERWVHSIKCEGRYLKPETKLPPFTNAFWESRSWPADGEIFTMPYDEFLTRMKESRPKRARR